ncbi:hypothetical protein D3C75_562950 [compost metagenome]
MQLQCHVCIFCGVTPSQLEIYLVEGQLLFTFTGNLFKSDGCVLQPACGKAVHVMTSCDAIKNIGLKHGIERNSAKFDIVVLHDATVKLEVLPNLKNAFIFK